MRVIDPGHRYGLESADMGGDEQILQFVEKAPKAPGSTELELLINGTTNDEVLAVLIDRVEFLQERLPCIENGQILHHLREARDLVLQRTKDRQERGVEGTSQN